MSRRTKLLIGTGLAIAVVAGVFVLREYAGVRGLLRRLSSSDAATREWAQQMLLKEYPVEAATEILDRTRRRYDPAECEMAVDLMVGNVRYNPWLEGGEKATFEKLQPLLLAIGGVECVQRHVREKIEKGNARDREYGVTSLRWFPREFATPILLDELRSPRNGQSDLAALIVFELDSVHELTAGDAAAVARAADDGLATDAPKPSNAALGSMGLLGSRPALRVLAQRAGAPSSLQKSGAQKWVASLVRGAPDNSPDWVASHADTLVYDAGTRTFRPPDASSIPPK